MEMIRITTEMATPLRLGNTGASGFSFGSGR
jgi:hypothetical protein